MATRSPSPAASRRSSRYSEALNNCVIAGSLVVGPWPSGLGQVHVVVVERLAVDPVARGGDPGSDLATLVHRVHQGTDKCFVGVGGQPLPLAALPLVRGELLPRRRGLDGGERADLAVERDV